MATASGFVWIQSPTIIIGNLGAYETRLQQAIGELADYFAAQMEAHAKSSAPWNDVTGAARAGLRTTVEKSATQVVISLIHSVHYGVYLELGTRYMAPRPVILPTLEAHHGPIMDRVRALIGA